MAGTEGVVYLGIDLPVVRIEAGTRCGPEVRISVCASHPLMDAGIQAIAAVENIGVRHQCEVFLAHSGGVHSRAKRIPRSTLYNRIRTIGPRRRIQKWTEHTEVSELARVRRAVCIRCWPHRITE